MERTTLQGPKDELMRDLVTFVFDHPGEVRLAVEFLQRSGIPPADVRIHRWGTGYAIRLPFAPDPYLCRRMSALGGGPPGLDDVQARDEKSTDNADPGGVRRYSRLLRRVWRKRDQGSPERHSHEQRTRDLPQ